MLPRCLAQKLGRCFGERLLRVLRGYPHPSPLPKGEGTTPLFLLMPPILLGNFPYYSLSLWERVGVRDSPLPPSVFFTPAARNKRAVARLKPTLRFPLLKHKYRFTPLQLLFLYRLIVESRAFNLGRVRSLLFPNPSPPPSFKGLRPLTPF